MSKKIFAMIVLLGLTTVLITQHSMAQQEESPRITHGPISGEVTANSVVLWARGNNNGAMTFELSESPEFTEVILASTEITAAHDYTGETMVEGLSPAQTYYYRVSLDNSEPVEGQFETAPAEDEAAAFEFLFGACLGGQGYCRDPETGWDIFNAMTAEDPDFFLFTGDTIYSSDVCPSPENTPGAEAPAQDLESFRARYKYHLEDAAYAQFLAQTPVYVTWDDHEVRDNYSGVTMADLNPQRLLDGQQSFFEYWPVMPSEEITETYQLYRQHSYGAHADFFILDTRTYRDPIVNWDPNPVDFEPKTMLGEEQFTWLQNGLNESDATWKFVVTSVPLSYPTGFPQPQVEGRDSWANFTDKSGYETELLALIFYLEAQNIDNVIFLTGDTHWPFAISYDPDRDGEANFYEFASSPLSALVLPPAPAVDPTLNPTVLYAEGEFAGELFNFGKISINETGALTFQLLDQDGTEQYSQTVQPE